MKPVTASLRSRLIALIAVGIVPVCLFAVLLGHRYYQYAIDQEREKVASSAHLAVSLQAEQTHDAQQLLMTMASMPEIRARKAGYCGVIASLLKQNAPYANLGMFDASGREVCSGVPTAHAPGFADDPWFMQAMHQKVFFVSDYRVGRITGKTVTLVALPLTDDAGRVQGGLYAAIDLTRKGRLELLSALPEHSVLVIFDESGLILQRFPDPGAWVGKRLPKEPLFREVIKRGGQGIFEMAGLDGKRRLFAAETLESKKGRVYLATGIPNDIAYAGVRKELLLSGAGMLLAILAMLLLAVIAGERLIVRRIKRLTGLARRFEQGHYADRSEMTGARDEIGELARSMDGLAEAVQRRDDALAQHLQAFDEHAIVSTTDVAGTIVYINNKFCEISGYSREELIGQNHRLLNSGYHPPRFFEEMWETISAGRVWHGDLCNRRKDGGRYWVASTIVPFLDESGLPVRFFSIRTDITKSLAIGESLRNSEERFRLLAENSLDIISLNELDGSLIYVSPSCQRVLGYSPEELAEHNGYEHVHPDDAEKLHRCMHEPVLRGEMGECDYFRVRCKNGEYVWLSGTAVPIVDEHGSVQRMQASLRDVTQRKRAEDALHLHDRAIAASASGIVIFRRDDLVIEYANAAFSQLVGAAENDLPGRHWPVISCAAGSEGEWCSLHEALSVGIEWHALLEGVTQQGTHVWCDVFVSPVKSERGALTHCVAAVVDMSDRVAMEKALGRAKDAAEKASHAKSEFLSHISHELRTPLNAIVGFAQLLESDAEAPLNAEQQDSVERILRAGWLLRDLIGDVLDLARIEAGRLELKMDDVDVTAVLRECRELIAAAAAEKKLEIIDLSSECATRLVFADAMRLKQVLINLLSNAVKYNRDGGSVTIACHCLENGGKRIAITDTGIGIPPEKRGELFQQFSRLGADQSGIPGVGVGLALSRRIMQLMGGDIGVESVPGTGSTFWIELPPASVQAQPFNAGDEGHFHLLYVESNPKNREHVRGMLTQRAGWQLLEAANGHEGIAAARAQRPALILLGSNLPDMSSSEVLAELSLAAETFAIPVLASRNEAELAHEEAWLAAGFAGQLDPAFGASDLWNAIDSVLLPREPQDSTSNVSLMEGNQS